MEAKKITGTVLAVQDLQTGVNILIETAPQPGDPAGKPQQLQIISTRHSDLEQVKRGKSITITVE